MISCHVRLSPQFRNHHILIWFTVCCAMMTVGLSAQDRAHEAVMWMEDVVSSFPNVRDVTISPDGSEYYFTVESVRKDFSVIVMMRRDGDRWTAPEVASFSGQYRDIEPAFAAGGNELFFASARPLDPSTTSPKDYDIWKVTRSDAHHAWSEPVNLGGPVNTSKDEYYPSLTMWGDLYFTREADDPSRKEDIFVSRKKNGSYESATPLSDAVNSKNYEFNAFVAPDESFMIFTSYARNDDMGGGDLYISYRRDGEWSPARHMGKHVNSARIDYCPYVDTRNGILYFTSERSSMNRSYNVPHTLGTLMRTFRTGPVGSGRIYTIPFTPDQPGK